MCSASSKKCASIRVPSPSRRTNHFANGRKRRVAECCEDQSPLTKEEQRAFHLSGAGSFDGQGEKAQS
jgi:hypothetical protein